jgi:vancomycin resistance protein YoaR
MCKAGCMASGRSGAQKKMESLNEWSASSNKKRKMQLRRFKICIDTLAEQTNRKIKDVQISATGCVFEKVTKMFQK